MHGGGDLVRSISRQKSKPGAHHHWSRCREARGRLQPRLAPAQLGLCCLHAWFSSLGCRASVPRQTFSCQSPLIRWCCSALLGLTGTKAITATRREPARKASLAGLRRPHLCRSRRRSVHARVRSGRPPRRDEARWKQARHSGAIARGWAHGSSELWSGTAIRRKVISLYAENIPCPGVSTLFGSYFLFAVSIMGQTGP